MMIFHACDQIERIILDQEWLFFFFFKPNSIVLSITEIMPSSEKEKIILGFW